MEHLAKKLINWASILEPGTREQALRTATMPFIWPHLATTLIEALLAFVIGTVFGVGCGLALARVELLARVFDPYIRILNALPPYATDWFALPVMLPPGPAVYASV